MQALIQTGELDLIPPLLVVAETPAATDILAALKAVSAAARYAASRSALEHALPHLFATWP